MKYSKKIYKKHPVFVISLCVVLFFIYFLFAVKRRESFSFFGDVVRDISFKIQSVFLPRERIEYTDFSKTINLEMKKELEDMKRLLDLNQLMSDFTMVNATVISRNKEEWFHSITIDKGKKDGIVEDMAVMTADGLIGKVIHTTSNTSEVKLITTNEENHKIAVNVEYNGNVYNGILQGYDSSKNQLSVISIRSSSDIPIGSEIRTSGLGEIFPRGISIGVVEELAYDSLGISKILKVKSKVNFENIRFVSVISRRVK